MEIARDYTFSPNPDGSWAAVNSTTGERTVLTAEMIILLANLNAGRLGIAGGNILPGSQNAWREGILRPQIRQLLSAGILAEDDNPTSPERRPPPAFVIGSYRSGTTLLRHIIDAHPRLACPAESKFIS